MSWPEVGNSFVLPLECTVIKVCACRGAYLVQPGTREYWTPQTKSAFSLELLFLMVWVTPWVLIKDGNSFDSVPSTTVCGNSLGTTLCIKHD